MDREPQWNVTLNLNVWIWLALVPLFITHATSKLDKPISREITKDNNPGFISIDCGLNIEYVDNITGILYKTDQDFIETGVNHRISSDVDLNYPYFGKQLNTLRYFPEGDRNCYTLKPEQGKNNKYLIRAFFSYGNYDGKNENQTFDLYLGVNLWETVSIASHGYYQVVEIIHTPSTDTINFCLVKTGPTIPFISSLELRPLNNFIYPIISNPQLPLSLQARVDVGSSKYPYHSRYTDDIYDRIWVADVKRDGWYPLKEDKSIDLDPINKDDAYKLPAEVLHTAAQSMNVSYPLAYNYDSVYQTELDKPFEYYLYFHFAEIEKLPNGNKRIINITLNSESILSKPLVLEYLKPVTIRSPNTAQGYVQFNISATSESDAPPILNAFEIYKSITDLNFPTDTRDVDAILDIKSAYQISRPNWQGDPCVPNQFAWDGLNCSSHKNPRITSINLSSSQLSGVINISFSYLTELEVLDLSNNELEGPLPKFLAEMPKLKILNLRGNSLSGPIPKALKEKANLQFLSVANNPDLCMTDSCKKNFVIPVIVASLSAVIVILLISLGFFIFKRRQKVVVVHSKSKEGVSLESKNRVFSYSEIRNITSNFKTIIGEGGFGMVYYGILQDHTHVAVKLLSSSSNQGYKEFRAEAQLLMVVHHRNLVSLIGYGDEGETKALIYEYMANGNLRQLLSEENPNILKWNERLKIAVDAAHGLDYLHNGCKPQLVHRDMKTSNILLDQNMQAKIADFGLCRAFVNDHISTRPAGTPGYVDPEFQRTGESNTKTDVYSFGIILFELITGKPALTRVAGEIIHILQWARPILGRGDIQNIVDPRLQGEFTNNSAWKFVDIALSCVSSTASERLDICQILVELKECLSLEMFQGHINRESALELTISHTETDIVPLAR